MNTDKHRLRKNKLKKSVFICVPLWLLLASQSQAAEKFQRIVSLAPSCTEILAGLGLQHQIAGITTFTDYPAEVLSLPVVGSYVDPNLEAIVSLKPDLVVATTDGNPHRILERLRSLQIRVHAMDLQTYGSIQQSIVQLGKLTGKEKRAADLVRRMQLVARCIQQKTAGQPGPSVLFIYDGYPFVTPGKNAFTNQLIEMAGGRSITVDAAIAYPRLTIETVIAKNPDVVIETSMDPNQDREKKLRWWAQYPMLSAVQRNRVYVLESRNLDRPSQLIVIGLRELAATLQPQLFQAGDCQ